MKLLITGASGFIGRQIIPHLERLGYDFLLVGRDVGRMRDLFPKHDICDYDNLKIKGVGCDAILHLAVVNNDSKADVQAFRSINVNLLEKVAKDAASAKIPHFINLSSTHSQLANHDDNYSISKREGEIILKTINLPLVSNYYLPAVYGSRFHGKLSFVNYIPKFFQPLTLEFVASLRPILSIKKLAGAIHAEIVQGKKPENISTTEYRNIYLTNTQYKNIIFALQKRFIDLFSALFLLFILSWILIITAILVRISSPGPVIFSQQRIGKNKKEFICYKFRTMSVDTPDQPTHLTSQVQLTKVGRFLRKTKLDELPQLFNIVRNDMSLVGPRPCLPSQSELIDLRSEMSVFAVKPGITGLAQIKAIDMSDPVKLAIEDAKYVALQTVPGDVMLIVRTLLGSGQGDRIMNQ